jgi:hypothetical protein
MSSPALKVCFYLQRRYAVIGNVTAYHIKKEFPRAEFCGLVGTRESLKFLEDQRDVTYTSLILDEDIHKRYRDEVPDMEYLRALEKEYGIPNLMPYLHIDRILLHEHLLREYPHDERPFSHDDLLRILQVTAKAIIQFLDEERPDVVVISVVGTIASLLLYHIAKKRGIQTINIEFARIGNRIAYSEDYRNFSWVKERFEEIRRGAPSSERAAAQKYIDAFRAKPAPYDAEYMQEFYNDRGRFGALSFLHPKKLARSIPWHLRTFVTDLIRLRRRDYTDIFIWWALWDKLKRKLRTLRGFSDLYSVPRPEDRYAYYPLHIEPEIAMMLYAPYYTNQLELIRACAHALPIDMLLYVKEHPGMVGYRPRSFYKEVLKIPNVRLIAPGVSSTEISRRASLTFTITSTAGWESLVLKNPVITFGDVYYNDIPGVERCRGFEELPYLVRKQLTEWKHDEDALVAYASALLEDSVAADFSDFWNRAEAYETIRDDAGIAALSRKLASKLRPTAPRA